MERAEYTKLADYESWYWWYRAQRGALVDAIRGLHLPPGARVLDAGCGTGRNLAELGEHLDIFGCGVDLSRHAALHWNGSAGDHRQVASVNDLPYASSRFDAVVSVDVLYHADVDPERAVSEMARVLRPSGQAVFIVPAYQWLLSRHDAAVHSARRFTRRELRRLMEGAQLRVDRLTHLFAPFLPAVAVWRMLTRASARASDGPAASDLGPLPRWANSLLYAVARVEQTVARHVDMPMGSTILGVGRKGAS